MTEYRDEVRLTPAARDAVEELVEDYRQSMLRRAVANARRIGSGEITVSDVLRSYEMGDYADRGERTWRRARVASLLSVYTALGVAVAAGGAVVLLIRVMSDASSADRFLAVATAIGVFMTALSALGTVSLRRVRVGGVHIAMDAPADQVADVISSWADFELEAKVRLSDVVGESAVSEMRLVDMLDQLAEHRLISADDVRTLRQVLGVRNDVVHGKPTPSSVLGASVRNLDRVARRLRS